MQKKFEVLCFTPIKEAENKAVLERLEALGLLDDMVQLYRDSFGGPQNAWRARNQIENNVEDWPYDFIANNKVAPGAGNTLHVYLVDGKLAGSSYTNPLSRMPHAQEFLKTKAPFILEKYKNIFVFGGLMVVKEFRKSEGFVLENGKSVAEQAIAIRKEFCKKSGCTGGIMYSGDSEQNAGIVRSHESFGWTKVDGVDPYHYYPDPTNDSVYETSYLFEMVI